MVHPYSLANNPDTIVQLTDEQANAVIRRDQILAKDLGVNFDIYMSLIDPDYPTS